jgi:hypothetical protein
VAIIMCLFFSFKCKLKQAFWAHGCTQKVLFNLHLKENNRKPEDCHTYYVPNLHHFRAFSYEINTNYPCTLVEKAPTTRQLPKEVMRKTMQLAFLINCLGRGTFYVSAKRVECKYFPWPSKFESCPICHFNQFINS